MATDLERLLARRANTTTVELSAGDVVVVRGMTRAEAAEMRKLDEDDVLGLEAFALATCVVEPKMTVEQARLWLENDEHVEIQKVINAIQQKNGEAPDQPKGYTKSVSRRKR